MERTCVVSRNDKIVKKVKHVEFYTFDEMFFTKGCRSICFYNEKRDRVDEVLAEPGDVVTQLGIGFHAPVVSMA